VQFVGTSVRRVLSSDADLTLVLCDRECAAVWLFDCPTILVTMQGGFEAWVEASYLHSFVANAARIHEQLAAGGYGAPLRAINGSR
jgi:hypothetical protein